MTTPVYSLDLETLDVTKYESQTQAAQELSINRTQISRSIAHPGRMTAGKKFWYNDHTLHLLERAKPQTPKLRTLGIDQEHIARAKQLLTLAHVPYTEEN